MKSPFCLSPVTACISLFPLLIVAACSTETASTGIVQGSLKIYGNDSYPVYMRRPLPVDAPRARYPGFKPKTLTLKAGTIRREGATPLTCDIVFERDVPVTLRDGVVIYTDIFRPVSSKRVPAIVAWSPYGKEVGGQWLDDVTGRSGVPLSNVSELQKFEAPDPAYWVAKGYAVLNPDARGSYSSGGNITYWGRQLAEDGYDFVEWSAALPWCSGKVGMSGNSWLAVSQWFIAAEDPPHLAAIAPWEGLTDVYRDVANRGGVPSPGFNEAIITTFAGNGLVEDVPRMTLSESLLNQYWQDKAARLHKIKVPAYIVGSYTNNLHTHGSFDGFREISSKNKWLRVHNSYEWPDYYDSDHVEDLRRFFDRYLKGERNDWESMPRVRLSILDPGAEDTVDRVAADWPVPGLATKALYLHANNSLRDVKSGKEASVSYDVTQSPSGVSFNYRIPRLMEINGYMKLRLWVSTLGSSDMDLSVTVEKRSKNGTAFVNTAGGESSSTISAQGILRVSLRGLDSERSTEYEPYHSYNHEELLSEQEIVPVEISLWPIALRFHPGELLTVTVSPVQITSAQMDLGFGTAIVPVPENETTFPPKANVSMIELGGAMDSNPAFVNEQRVETPDSRNNGTHIIHVGGKFDSLLLMPVNVTISI